MELFSGGGDNVLKVREILSPGKQSSGCCYTMDAPRAPNWTEEERLLACQLINERQDVLFNKFKGATLSAKDKIGKWQEIAKSLKLRLNASCNMQKLRTVKELKKMYSNVKQRAKEKDGINKRTGGGPMKKLSPVEDLVLQSLADRPQLVGIIGGLESGVKDACTSVSTSCTSVSTSCTSVPTSCTNVPTSCTSVPTSCTNVPTTSTAVSTVTEQSTAVDVGGDKSSETYTVQVEPCRKRTRKRSRQDDEDNLYELEHKRLNIEIKKQLAELDLAQQRIKNEQTLFEIRQKLLESYLEWAYEENLNLWNFEV